MIPLLLVFGSIAVLALVLATLVWTRKLLHPDTIAAHAAHELAHERGAARRLLGDPLPCEVCGAARKSP